MAMFTDNSISRDLLQDAVEENTRKASLDAAGQHERLYMTVRC